MVSIEIVLALGVFIGFVFGLSMGIAIGRKEKPWHELTDEEKHKRKLLICAGVVILVLGLATGIWQFLTVL
jgi:hypothetical protein